jgi:hypothetical protein
MLHGKIECNQLREVRMQLSHEEVRKIAELAKLELTEDEVRLYAGQLSAILGYFRDLQTLDTSAIPPTAFTISRSTSAAACSSLFCCTAGWCSPALHRST